MSQITGETLTPLRRWMLIGCNGMRAMDKTIARLNIKHYQEKLATEQDETKRQTLLRLLADEQAKLSALDDPPTKKRRKNY